MVPSALANRLFEVLGDPVTLQVVRRLEHSPYTQAELVRLTGAPQSAVSRATSTLRILGLTTATSQRGKIVLRASPGVTRLLSAANELAHDLIAVESGDQAALSAESANWDEATARPDDGLAA